MVTGIMLSVVEPEFRPQANALANTMYQAFGFFPAPFIYGFICENTGGSKSKWGMLSTFMVSIPSGLFLFVALYYKPDLRDYWESRKQQLIKHYMQENMTSERLATEKVCSFDDTLS